MEEEKHQVQLMLPKSTYEWVKKEAKARNNTVPGFLRYIIASYRTALEKKRVKLKKNQ